MNDDPDLIGKTLGSYQITHYLQRGWVADVYTGRDVALQRQVVIKLLRPEMAQQEAYRRQFRAEAEAIAQIEHAHIVQLYSSDVMDGGRPYIVLPYVEGGTLRDAIIGSGGAVPVVQALNWSYQVADAMRELHSRELVHGAIQPDVVLLRLERTAVLTSLGRAFWADLLPVQSQWPPYASPEQLEGTAVDGRSDVYGIGLLLYALITGENPFSHAADSWPNEPKAVISLLPGLTPETAVLIHRCLAPKPKNRFETVSELMTSLERASLAEGGRPYTSLRNVFQLSGMQQDVVQRADVLTPTPSAMSTPPTQTKPPKMSWPTLVVALMVIVALFFVGWRIYQQSAETPDVALVTTIPPQESAVAVVNPVTPEPILLPTSTLAPLPTATSTPLPTPTPTIEPTSTRHLGPEWTEYGRSVLGKPLQVVRFGDGETVLILVGGLHAGFNPASVELAERLIAYFEGKPTAVPDNVTLYIIPSANPDSLPAKGLMEGRLNAHGVDMNRNWDCRWSPDAEFNDQYVSGGTAVRSEPEADYLAEFILGNAPAGVIFWQARDANGLSSFGACGLESQVSYPMAKVYGDAAGYNTDDYELQVNKALTGDVTNWLDKIGIPGVSVLLPDYDDMDWENNLEAVLAVLETLSVQVDN